MISIGGKFAAKNAGITKPLMQHLCEEHGAVLTDENGARLFIWQESERELPEGNQNESTN